MVSIKFVLMLSMLVLAVSADDDQTKINAAQTILTLTNSLVQIKNLLTGNITLESFNLVLKSFWFINAYINATYCLLT